jgi:hypothetical protein
MKTKEFTEAEFFEAHDRIKAAGFRILRCLQLSTPKGLFFRLTWLEK